MDKTGFLSSQVNRPSVTHYGDNKRGLCLAWVLCRMAGKNSFCYRIGHIFFSQRNYVPTAAPLSKGRLPLFSHFFRATF